MGASGKTELVVEPSGIVLGLIQQIIFFQRLVLDDADDKAAVTEPPIPQCSHSHSGRVYISFLRTKCPRCVFAVILTFSAVHMRAAYLVHQEHKDEAQDQRHADAGVKLLVTVLMFPTGAQG